MPCLQAFLTSGNFIEFYKGNQTIVREFIFQVLVENPDKFKNDPVLQPLGHAWLESNNPSRQLHV